MLDRVFRCLAVSNGIEHQCHEQCGHHIKYGMLLDKYRCQNDAAHQCEGAVFHELVVTQVFASCQCDVGTDRIEYVDARKQICRSIGLPQPMQESEVWLWQLKT